LRRNLGSRETAKLLRNHIRILCSFHGIKEVTARHGQAEIDDRIVYLRPVKSERTYAEALHEIGHILGPWQKASEIAAECGAWIWARKNALQWTKSMEHRMAYCLGSYVKYANDNKDSEFPVVGHPAWKTLRMADAKPRKRKLKQAMGATAASRTPKRKKKP
jgi:hypothetical protein